MSPYIRLALWVGAIVTLSWLAIAIIEPDGRGSLEYIAIGHFFGVMFAHVTLAAAWTALGPGALIWRLPFSIVWVVMVVAALGIHAAFGSIPDNAIMAVGLCLIGQFVALQFPLWLLVVAFRLSLRHNSESKEGVAKQLQFGIWQLMIVTAIAAGLMGVGRLVLATITFEREHPVFIFLVIAAIVQSVPLILATLLRRFAIPAVLGILVLTAIATYWEASLFQVLNLGRGPDIGHFVAMNAFTTLFTLIVALTVRLNGFSLQIRNPQGGT